MAVSVGKLRAGRIFKAWHIATATTAMIASLLLGWALYCYSDPEDLRDVFLPAARQVLAGQSPYSVPKFYGPPWALAPALLVAWLSDQMAFAVFGILSILALVGVFLVRKAPPMRAVPVLLSLPVICSILYGNLEPFVLLALIVPRPLGLILLAMKPHLGIILALYWVLDEFRAGGVRAIGRLLWPVCALTGLSFLAYGFWPGQIFGAVRGCGDWGWNIWALMPWDLWAHVFFLGIPVTICALWREKEDIALGAGILVSPYTYVYGFVAWVPAVTRAPAWVAWLFCLVPWALAVFLAF